LIATGRILKVVASILLVKVVLPLLPHLLLVSSLVGVALIDVTVTLVGSGLFALLLKLLLVEVAG
jgi:hypothetical protein